MFQHSEHIMMSFKPSRPVFSSFLLDPGQTSMADGRLWLAQSLDMHSAISYSFSMPITSMSWKQSIYFLRQFKVSEKNQKNILSISMSKMPCYSSSKNITMEDHKVHSYFFRHDRWFNGIFHGFILIPLRHLRSEEQNNKICIYGWTFSHWFLHWQLPCRYAFSPLSSNLKLRM